MRKLTEKRPRTKKVTLKDLPAKNAATVKGRGLANVDLQTSHQNQQQLVEMASSISKQVQDITLSVVRKVGG